MITVNKLKISMAFTLKSVVFWLIAFNIFAQGGDIKGKVTDKQYSEPLIGANIIIISIQRGVATDIDGLYEIKNIPAGTYSIKVSFVGYAPLVKQEVDVKNSETLILNFELEPDSYRFHYIVGKKQNIKETTSCPPPWSVDMLPIRGIYHLNILERFKLNPPNVEPVLLKDSTTNKNISK